MRCKLCISLGSRGHVICQNGATPTKQDLLNHCQLHAKQIRCFAQVGDNPENKDSNGDPRQNPIEDSGELFRACFGDVPVAPLKTETPKVEDVEDHHNRASVKVESRETSPNKSITKGKPRQSHKDRYPIATFCKTLFAKRRWTPKIVCSLCAKSLTFLCGGRTATNNSSITRHAIAHLGLPMYSCGICPLTSTTREAMRIHLLQGHALSNCPPNYEDRTNRYTKQICGMIERCFGTSSKNGHRGDPSIFFEHFRKLHTIVWKRARYVRCNECRRDLMAVHEDETIRVHSTRVVDHAMAHMRKFLFACKLCTHRTCRRAAMFTHLHKVHKLGSHIQNYTDSTMENRGRILEMIEKCFGRVNDESTSRDWEAPISTTIMATKSRAGDNHQLAERLLYSRELYKSFGNTSTVECRVCHHQIKCDRSQSQKFIWHASTHTTRPLYECKRCAKSIHVMSSVYRHMKKEHAITKGIKAEIIDHSDVLHQEIMDALKRCFDQGDP